MRSLSSVVWSEGMHLAPHHFQAQGRYFEDVQHFLLSSLFPFSHGLIGLEMDAEALRNGTVAVVHARGIMPDGLPFHFPHDPAPEPLPVGERFSPTARSHRVLLGISPFRPTGANCRTGPNGASGDFRFSSRAAPVVDAITGQDEKPVVLARKNFRLILEDEDAGATDGEGDEDVAAPNGLVTLPLARVKRDGTGNFVYDHEFVPPSLQVGASRSLVELLQRTTEILEDRAAVLAAEGGAPGSALEHGTGELVRFWFLHAVNSGLAILRHHLSNRALHPERLFADLSELTGALSTFSLTGNAARLPVYDHENPGPGFRAMEREFRQLLETVLPTNLVRLPVELRDGYFHTVQVTDSRLLGSSANWYLGVRSGTSRDDAIRNVPRLVKVCSAKHIERLVREAYPGLGLEHVSTPPTGLSPRPGTEYFEMDRTEPCWTSIRDTSAMGIYVPEALPEARLDVAVLME